MIDDEKEHSVIVSDRADYDSPWKKALEAYFKECIQFRGSGSRFKSWKRRRKWNMLPAWKG